MYFLVAALFGHTASNSPFCHWTRYVSSLFCWVFFPYEMNLTGPKAVFMSVADRASRTSLGVMLFARFRASATTYIAAYASAPWYSVSEPYFFWNLLKYSLAPGNGKVSIQSVAEKTPSDASPALLANSGSVNPAPPPTNILGLIRSSFDWRISREASMTYDTI